MCADYTSGPLPLVNNLNIAQYVNQYVIIHGSVSSIKNNTLYLKIQQEPSVEVLVNNFTKSFSPNAYLKIIGKVAQDKSIEFLDCYLLQDDFDLDIVNEMIPMMNNKEVAGLFYS